MPRGIVVVTVQDVTGQFLQPDSLSLASEFGSIAQLTTTAAGAGTRLEFVGAAPFWLMLTVTRIGYWEVVQRFLYLPSDTGALGPQVSPSGGHGRHVNVACLEIVQPGGTDERVQITIVLGQLRHWPVATGTIDRSFELTPPRGGAAGSHDRYTHLGGTPCLVSGNEPRVNDTGRVIAPRGTVHLLERSGTEAPRIVAAYRPSPLRPSAAVGLGYHLYFCPFLPPEAHPGPYPAGPGYIDLLQRYLLTVHQMVHHHAAAGRAVIFVFPLGVRGGGMGQLPSQANVYRLLQELNFWLQSTAPIGNEFVPVGRIALSCFSAGIHAHGAVLRSDRFPPFWDRLKEIYDFDGVYAGDPRSMAQLVTLIEQWGNPGNQGMQDRRLRIYTQSGAFARLGSLTGGRRVAHVHGASETSGPTGTLLDTPFEFWHEMNPKVFRVPGDVHGYFQDVFMYHALMNSGFPAA